MPYSLKAVEVVEVDFSVVKFDKNKGAGWWIFKLPTDDPYQLGSDDHDDEAERKARGLPTQFSREGGNDALEKTWDDNIEQYMHQGDGEDRFARAYEAARRKVFRAFIWIFQKPLQGWKSGRITECQLDERGNCICMRDRDKFGNKP